LAFPERQTPGQGIPDVGPLFRTLPDGGVTQLNSYGAFAYEESVRGNSVVPLTPDQDGGTPLGWEPIATGSTVATPAVIPPARHSAAIFRGFFGFTAGTLSFSVPLVGGLDGSNAFVDAPGTFYGINPNGGGLAGLVTPPQSAPFTTQPAPYRTLFWQANEPTTAGAFIGVDSPAGRAGVALGPGTSNNTCTGACTDYSDYLNIFLLAGGNTTNATTGTNRIYAFGTRTHNTPGGSRQYLGWWDVTQETGVLLPFNNYNMSFAPSPGFTNSLPTTLGGGGQFTPGMMLVGGALNTQFTNDANGCLTVAALYQNPNPPQYQVASCTDANWTTTSGRRGQAKDSFHRNRERDGSCTPFTEPADGIVTGKCGVTKNRRWAPFMGCGFTRIGPRTGKHSNSTTRRLRISIHTNRFNAASTGRWARTSRWLGLLGTSPIAPRWTWP